MTTNKSAFVREVLKEIGALSDNPPEDWRKQVYAKLEQHNLPITKTFGVMLSQIRRKELDKLGDRSENSKNRITNIVQKKKEKVQKEETFSISDLQTAKGMAEKFGGTEKLINVLKAVRSLQS